MNDQTTTPWKPLRCLNQVQLIGRLVEAADIRTIAGSGKAVCNFEVETVERIRGDERRERHRVSAFGPVAEALTARPAGTPLHILGSLRSREFGEGARRRRVYETVAFQVIVMGEQAYVGEEPVGEVQP